MNPRLMLNDGCVVWLLGGLSKETQCANQRSLNRRLGLQSAIAQRGTAMDGPLIVLFKTTDSCQLVCSSARASAGQSVEASRRRQLCCWQVPACLGLSTDVPAAIGGTCRQDSCRRVTSLC